MDDNATPDVVEPKTPQENELEAPQETEADVEEQTEEQHEAAHIARIQTGPVQKDLSIAFSSGVADPPSPTLDLKEGDSGWGPETYTPITLGEMPAEGPGSPGYDVYNPSNALPYVAKFSGLPLDNHDEEDVQAALARETHDGLGETPEDQLPESDVDPNEELAEDYPDLQPAPETPKDPA